MQPRHQQQQQYGQKYDSNSTQLALIVADTGELQTNQGNWLTVTGYATAASLATAQTDLNTITGSDGVTLATAQALYAPAKAGDNMGSVSSVTGAVGSVTAEVSADVTKVNASATAAVNLSDSLLTMLPGTATGGSTTTVTSALTGYGADNFKGRALLFRTGTNVQYQGGSITAYDSTTGTFTFAAGTFTTGATNGDLFVIV